MKRAIALARSKKWKEGAIPPSAAAAVLQVIVCHVQSGAFPAQPLQLLGSAGWFTRASHGPSI